MAVGMVVVVVGSVGGMVEGMVVVGMVRTQACSVVGMDHSSSCCLYSSLKALQLLRIALQLMQTFCFS
jgi:threonine dehydratase